LDLKFRCELTRDAGRNFKSTFKIHDPRQSPSARLLSAATRD
jgi:hypothetical protein